MGTGRKKRKSTKIIYIGLLSWPSFQTSSNLPTHLKFTIKHSKLSPYHFVLTLPRPLSKHFSIYPVVVGLHELPWDPFFCESSAIMANLGKIKFLLVIDTLLFSFLKKTQGRKTALWKVFQYKIKTSWKLASSINEFLWQGDYRPSVNYHFTAILKHMVCRMEPANLLEFAKRLLCHPCHMLVI